MKRLSAILLVGALVFGTVGCTNMNKTQQGLLSGAAGGAILGAGLGALTGGSGTTGALIGGGLGAFAGGIYGHSKIGRVRVRGRKLSGESFPSPRPHPFKDFRLVGRRRVGFPVREREMCLSKRSVCSQKTMSWNGEPFQLIVFLNLSY